MTRKLRILITNDDGYFSDGIRTLYGELKKQAYVYIVAPDREQSASSHSLTLNRPLRVQKLDKHRYAIDGTPTDCVMLALHLLFEKKRPDLIVSGINHGANMGDDITYSGTVAAAIEGSILGIPSIAVSMANYEPGTSMKRAARFVSRLVANSNKFEISPSTFLNINLPLDNGRPYRNSEFTRLGSRYYKDIVIHKTDPRGKPYFWIGGRPKWNNTSGSDFEAVNRGVVSITPLNLSLTDSKTLNRLRKTKWKI